jgi:ERCC4-type nuclease
VGKGPCACRINIGRVERVITADRQQLQTVEGIGDHIADEIRSAVEDQISDYGFDEIFPI